MSHFPLFVSGIILGVFLDQKYKLPKIESLMKKMIDTLEKNEKD
jgi:hypothetical protein